MNIKPLLLAASFCIATPAVFAQSNHDHHASTAMESAKPATPSEGTVRKIDKAAGKLTIAHGPLENLGMPGMTMAFRADAATLDKVQVGDKIRFVAERVDGVFSVTKLEVAK
ncbi:MAG TPA: copper-binding protein [Aromatoleum sp.]|uniref:copper-binding protein n=1 Tax=Aromatoleum sp. TaxID=2307007 RepID=UPI002B4920E2|nr:copper-binding protein [Aromatoleum sp.]HJV24958.1 copper-binding protein [Aromatoleum sp.]